MSYEPDIFKCLTLNLSLHKQNSLKPKLFRLLAARSSKLAALLAACSLQFAACTSLPSDVFEKNVTIPGHAWASSFLESLAETPRSRR